MKELRQQEPKKVEIFSGSLTPASSSKMIIFDPVWNQLPPTLSPHRPLSKKPPLGGGLTREKWQNA